MICLHEHLAWHLDSVTSNARSKEIIGLHDNKQH